MGPGTTLTNNSNTLEVTARVRLAQAKKKKKKIKGTKIFKYRDQQKVSVWRRGFQNKVTVGGAARHAHTLSTPVLLGRVGDIVADTPPQLEAWADPAMVRATRFSDAPQRAGARGIGSGFVDSWVLHEGCCNSSAQLALDRSQTYLPEWQ